MFRDVPGCSGMFHVPGFVNALSVARPTDGRQQNPEHGTFRNIPEQGKLSQNK